MSKLLKNSQQTYNVPARYDPLCPQWEERNNAFLKQPMDRPLGARQFVLGTILEPPSGEAKQGGVQTILDGADFCRPDDKIQR